MVWKLQKKYLGSNVESWMSDKGTQITLHKNRITSLYVANLYISGYFQETKEFKTKNLAIKQVEDWKKEYKEY